MQKENLSEKEFFQELIKVTQQHDRQSQYFEDVRSKAFASPQKSTMDLIHDGDINPSIKPHTETERSKRFIIELMQTRMRESFL